MAKKPNKWKHRLDIIGGMARDLDWTSGGGHANAARGRHDDAVEQFRQRQAMKQKQKLMQAATQGMTPQMAAMAQLNPGAFTSRSINTQIQDPLAQRGADRADMLAQNTMQNTQHNQDMSIAAQKYKVGRDQVADQRYADETTYGRGRDSIMDGRYAGEQDYRSTRDQIGDSQWAAGHQLNQQRANTAATQAAKTDLGKTPIYLRGQDGSVSIGQLGNGKIVPAQIADGMTILDPGAKAELQQQGRSSGKIQGEARGNLPSIRNNAELMLKTIGDIKGHPGTAGAVGDLQGRQPDWMLTGDEKAANQFIKQAQGQTFLQAYEALKGGGVITEIEGLKGEQALARLNRAQSDDDFNRALSDLESVVTNALGVAHEKAGMETPQAPQQQNMPTVGAVQDGYEFLGGDPSDPNSWRRR